MALPLHISIAPTNNMLSHFCLILFIDAIIYSSYDYVCIVTTSGSFRKLSRLKNLTKSQTALLKTCDFRLTMLLVGTIGT